ncbi:MAG: phytoene desaturase [Maritimibacter harenae]
MQATGSRAIVIGAGFGGLALAIRLQSAGISTTILEKRDKPGGRAYVYEKDGFTFDGGPTVITDPDALRELWDLSGRSIDDYVTLMPVSPFYQLCWEDGTRFDYVNDQDELARQIEALSPRDVAGYERFMKYSEDVYREGYLKLGTVPFLDFKSMMKAAPQLVRVGAYRSVYSKVASFIENDYLRQAFSFHTLLVGGNPFDTSSIYALIHALERRGGVWWAKGGTGALVKGMVKLFEDLGGTIRTSAEVEQLITAGDRITGVRVAGEVLEADLVASNGDVVHTYDKLLGGTRRGKSYAKALKRKRFSMSLFVTYFGLKGQPENLRHHMILFGNRYRGLIDDIFKTDKLSEDFSLYLHAPSVTDPTLAPEGHSTYYVLSPVPHLGTADIDWETEAPRYRDRIFDYLEKHHIPNLRKRLVTSHMLTPHGFRDDLNSHLGSAFSVEPILTQSAWFRPHNRDDVIRNLYIVGAGTHPGAGIPGVVGSAKATAGLMIEHARAEAPA